MNACYEEERVHVFIDGHCLEKATGPRSTNPVPTSVVELTFGPRIELLQLILSIDYTPAFKVLGHFLRCLDTILFILTCLFILGKCLLLVVKESYYKSSARLSRDKALFVLACPSPDPLPNSSALHFLIFTRVVLLQLVLSALRALALNQNFLILQFSVLDCIDDLKESTGFEFWAVF